MKKFLSFLLVILIVSVVILFLFRNDIGEFSIGKTVEQLGVPLKIDELKVDLLRTTVLADNITIYNPPGFKQETLAEIQKLSVAFVPKDILKGIVHFSEIEFNLSNLYIEKTRDGKINLNELNIKKDKNQSKMKYKIDKLILTLGHVKAVDYSHGMIPNIIETDMGIRNEVFSDVTDIKEIAKIVINKIISDHMFLGLGLAMEDVATVELEGAALVGEGAADVVETILPFDKKRETPKEIPSVPNAEPVEYREE